MRHILLRAARATQYLPAFSGLSTLLRLYQKFATQERLRISDFEGDLKLDVRVTDTIGINLWHAPRLFEKKEREIFCSAVQPGSAVLDVGANIGIYTLLAAKRNARVFSVEADPKNAEMLRHHIAINNFSERVTVFQMAAIEEPKTVSLFRNPRNSGGTNIFQGQAAGIIEGRTIDSLGLPPIDVCKIDIEGAEMLALRGMIETIKGSPNLKMLIECSSQTSDTSALLAFLRRHFRSIRVIGAERAGIPEFCNLWATRY